MDRELSSVGFGKPGRDMDGVDHVWTFLYSVSKRPRNPASVPIYVRLQQVLINSTTKNIPSCYELLVSLDVYFIVYPYAFEDFDVDRTPI